MILSQLAKGFSMQRGLRIAFALPENDEKMPRASRRWLRFGRRAKIVFAFAVVAVLLISFFVSLLSQNPEVNSWLGVNYVKDQPSTSSSLIVSGQPVNGSVWLKVAANAWAYFQPGVGVDSKTGLPYASGTNFEAFTAWDLGVYIQAIIDAQKLGLISVDGAWGSSQRLQKVMDFLQNRPRNSSTGYPFWFYDARNGDDYHSLSDKATDAVDGADMGRLFVALNNLRTYNSSMASSVDYLVYNQSDYAALLPGIEEGASSNSVYAYYIYSGFACFWPQQVGNIPNEVLTNIDDSKTVTTYGVSLPVATITCDPLLCSIFELDNSPHQLGDLMRQVYLAHEAYFDSTGKYVAFSEGNSFTSQYIYEWVVTPNGDTWKISGTTPSKYLDVTPIMYTKVAFCFLALYNSTFAQNLVVYLQKMLPDPSAKGYCDGADSSGQYIPGTGCNTNGLILDAALYAVQK